MESEVRFYRASTSCLVEEVARLNAVAPPRAVAEDAFEDPEVDDDHHGAQGLFLALVQGGSVVDFARLLFRGGEPSDADGGPDCYSSDRSTGDDRAPKARSKIPPPRSGREEEVSSEKFGSLSLCGGLVQFDEGNVWKLEGAGEADADLTIGDDEDWSTARPAQFRSSLWRRSGNSDSSSQEEEQDKELEGAGKADDDWTIGDDEDLSTARPAQFRSSFWRRSGNSDSSSQEEEQDKELEGAGKADDDWTIGDDEDLSTARPAQFRSSFWRRSENSDSSSEEEEQDNELEGPGEANDDWTSEVKDNESNTGPGYSSSSFGKSGNHDSTSDEEEEDRNREQGVNQDTKEQMNHCQSIQINLRIWPAQKHALIKIWCGDKWVLTKDYCLNWLNLEEIPESILKVEFGAPFADVLGFRNTSCAMDFEINDSSEMLNDLMTVIKPSIQNFQILKKVGGQDACRVFKCLFMGSKCALKALTQKDTSTSEPREIAIISNLKGTNVMVFYQAWIEPWSYNGRPKKDYLFIHLEFCPSTLKHAVRQKNHHWFPNKWILFEEIVRSVFNLHEHHVVHRDLKPDNVFFSSEMRVLIGDFGDSCIGHDEVGLYGGGTPKLGTEGYFAPELNSGGKITEKVGVYSLGMILLDLFAMFKTRSERILMLPKLTKEGPPDSWKGDHKLFGMMTAFDPNDRPSAAEVLDYIRQYHLEGTH